MLQAGDRTAGTLGFGGGGADGPPPRPGGGNQSDPVRALSGQGPGTLIAQQRGGTLLAYVSADTGKITQIGPASLGALTSLPVDGRTHAVRVDAKGYRALATRAPDGDVYITGLPTASVDATLVSLTGIELAVTGAGLVLVALAGGFLVRLTLRPLSRVAATAQRVTKLPLDRGDVPPTEMVPEGDTDSRTEVGQVGAALNSLLGHVGSALQVRHSSELRVRQFVADASHELRTPLASILGYAELSRRHEQSLPSDVSHALKRMQSEARRMKSRVEDLLLLARLDAGRPLQAAPVDLSMLVVDAVSDAHAAGPEHVWRLELPDEPVVVTGDAARLHQVIANLLSNARTHTPAGTIVTASVRTQPGTSAELAVLDDGPGVPTAALPTIFERFTRADTSRSRTAGSTGLGLAIVTAVVQSHGGTVEVTSRPGQTAFSVNLPLTPVEERPLQRRGQA